MAITYKGLNTIEGKHFIYNNERVTYVGKLRNDNNDKLFIFNNDTNLSYILTESELTDLQDYSINQLLEEDALNNEIRDELQNNYINKALDLINNLLSGKSTDKEELNSVYKDLMRYLKTKSTDELTVSGIQDSISLDSQKQYLSNLLLNKSEITYESIYSMLNNFIYSNKKEA